MVADLAYCKRYDEDVIVNFDINNIDNLDVLGCSQSSGDHTYPITLELEYNNYIHFLKNNDDVVTDFFAMKIDKLSELGLLTPKVPTVAAGKGSSPVDGKSNGAIKSDGGSSTYYDIAIPKWLLDVINQREKEGGAYVKTEELIEVGFGNDFNFGTLFKSTVRAYGCSVGAGKAGNDMGYEVNKVKYYSDKIFNRYSRSKGD